MRALWTLSLLSLAACPAALGGAGGGVGGGGSGSAGGSATISSQCANPDYGASAAARKIGGFLRASAAFTTAAASLDAELTDTCASMGRELGMTSGLSGDVQTVCQNVSAKIREEMRAVRGTPGVTIAIVTTPPRCEARIDAYASCAAECDVNVDPGELDVQCEGGQMVGQCSAECSGECSVEIEGECGGSCEGTCSAGCTGVCNGTCEGTCSSQGADGQCNGSCDGTCHGSCSAGCQGSCEGDCWVSGQASCDGECRGGCSVEYTEPRCTGTMRAPSVDAECDASCNAGVQAEMECTPGQAEVTISGDLGGMDARAQALRAALRGGFGRLLAIKERVRHIQATGQALIDAGRGLRGSGRNVLEAAGCLSEAFAAIPEAFGSVNVSVSVSVEVSGSVSAG